MSVVESGGWVERLHNQAPQDIDPTIRQTTIEFLQSFSEIGKKSPLDGNNTDAARRLAEISAPIMLSFCPVTQELTSNVWLVLLRLIVMPSWPFIHKKFADR